MSDETKSLGGSVLPNSTTSSSTTPDTSSLAPRSRYSSDPDHDRELDEQNTQVSSSAASCATFDTAPQSGHQDTTGADTEGGRSAFEVTGGIGAGAREALIGFFKKCETELETSDSDGERDNKSYDGRSGATGRSGVDS